MDEQITPKKIKLTRGLAAYPVRFGPEDWLPKNAECYKCGAPLIYSKAWVCPELSIWDKTTGRWTKLFCEECYAIIEHNLSKRLEEVGTFQR